jgi:hypothetical protein
MQNFIKTYLGKYAVAISKSSEGDNSLINRILTSTIRVPIESVSNLARRKNKEEMTEDSTRALVDLANTTERTLLLAKAVFPFELFPDTLRIDRQKITVIHNDFLKMAHTTSIRLKDLGNVEVVLGPFFGTIILTSLYYRNNTQTINFLTRNDAIHAHRLLQGFMVAHNANIDTDNISEEDLIELLYRIGNENV